MYIPILTEIDRWFLARGWRRPRSPEEAALKERLALMRRFGRYLDLFPRRDPMRYDHAMRTMCLDDTIAEAKRQVSAAVVAGDLVEDARRQAILDHGKLVRTLHGAEWSALFRKLMMEMTVSDLLDAEASAALHKRAMVSMVEGGWLTAKDAGLTEEDMRQSSPDVGGGTVIPFDPGRAA
jgi:hypothetical protein